MTSPNMLCDTLGHRPRVFYTVTGRHVVCWRCGKELEGGDHA